MDGTQWAYDKLVDLALVHSEGFVRERAKQFKREALDEMVGMACADIDEPRNERIKYAYETVRDVCIELVGQHLGRK